MLATRPFVLGTVQLGMPYGIANTVGKPSDDAALAIVRAALRHDIAWFDTAMGYGESESVLGRCFAAAAPESVPNVITKLPPCLEPDNASHLREMVETSLKRLGVVSLAGLMFHREEHLPLLDGALGEALKVLAGKGLFRAFGVSVYSPEAALAALAHPFISLVQIPASLFDRRFEKAGVFDAARLAGKELHLRSALLQGVLCLHPEQLPPALAGLAPALGAFRRCCLEHELEPAPLALAWLLRRYPHARVLFGAERPEQVNINLDIQKHPDSIPQALWEILDGIMPPQEAQLLNPSLWKN